MSRDPTTEAPRSAPHRSRRNALRGTPRKAPRWVFTLALSLLGSGVLLLVIAPLAGLLLATPTADLLRAARDTHVLESLRLTLVAAFWATITCTVGGIPLAWLLARHRFRGRSVLLALIDLPVVVPHVAAGVALLTVLGRESWIGGLTGGGLTGTTVGISVAMAFVSLPYLVNAAREGFEALPPRVEQTARTLGASPRQVFFTISLPLSWCPILTGMTLMWARGISEFGAVIIIAYYPMTTPVLVYQRLNDFGLSYARAAAVLLLLVCVVLFVALRFLARPALPSTGYRGAP